MGHTLDVRLRELVDQIVHELHFTSSGDRSNEAHRRHATDVVHEFASCLPQIREVLETDIKAAYEGDPAARSADEVLACYPGITAIIHHRLAHALYRLNMPLIARMIGKSRIQQRASIFTPVRKSVEVSLSITAPVL